MDGTAQETRFAKSILTTKFVAPSTGAPFESRGKRGLKIFTPPTKANYADPSATIIAEEAEEDPEELQAQRIRNAYRGHARHKLLEVLPKLSRRQREVVELLLEGLTFTQIGQRLGIHATTVRRHWQEAQESLHELLPEWRELFPLPAFVHTTDSREAWIEHNQRDNRHLGADLHDDHIEDRDEWHEKHGHSPTIRDLARFSADGQKRFAMPLTLDANLQSDYVRDKDKSTDVADERPLTEEQRRAIDAEILAANLERAAATLTPLETQANHDGASPEMLAAVLHQVTGDEGDVQVAVERSRLLWRLCARRYVESLPVRVATMGQELRKRPIRGTAPRRIETVKRVGPPSGLTQTNSRLLLERSNS